MSLDIYLNVPRSTLCPHCGQPWSDPSERIYEANVTHNLGGMAGEAEIYEVLWRGPENGIETAGQLIEPLERAIAAMKADPPRFEKHNPKNGWGSYEHFVPWVEELLGACKAHPESRVRVSR